MLRYFPHRPEEPLTFFFYPFRPTAVLAVYRREVCASEHVRQRRFPGGGKSPKRNRESGSSGARDRRVVSSRRFDQRSRVQRPRDPQHAAAILLVLVGAVLRLWQYLANSSLWIDETALARNIIHRSVAALLGSLDYAQVAPIGFLVIEKGIASFFGASEYALRAFPLVCGLCSLVIFWQIASRLLSGWAVPFAVGLFSLGIPFIYFSSQLKQYSTDVAAALLLLLAALEIRNRGVTPRRAFWLGIVGVGTAAFSQAALFVMFGIGAGLLILVFTERDVAAARAFAITWSLWALSAAVVAAHSVSSVSDLDREYFRWFWADGFMPMPPRSLSEAAWLPDKLTWVFGAFATGLARTNGGLNYRWSPVFSTAMLCGYWVLWRNRRDAALFLLLPVIVVLCLSAASLYPFTARLIAFLVPFLLLATAAGAYHLLTHLPGRVQFLSPVALAILGGAPVYAIATALPPSRSQHLRPVIEHVSQRREATDKIYVYYGAALAFRHYAPRLGISEEGVMFGRCALGEPRDYLRELDAARGEKRLWIVATHVQRSGELELLLGYLDQIGRRMDAIVVRGPSGNTIEDSSGYLYEFSDRIRLASASAETYAPVLDPVPGPLRRWGCYGVTGGEPAAH